MLAFLSNQRTAAARSVVTVKYSDSAWVPSGLARLSCEPMLSGRQQWLAMRKSSRGLVRVRPAADVHTTTNRSATGVHQEPGAPHDIRTRRPLTKWPGAAAIEENVVLSIVYRWGGAGASSATRSVQRD